MSLTLSDVSPSPHAEGQWFRIEASEVLGVLRNRVAGILSDLGNFHGPAEVQRALGLDKTLSRQVFKLASMAEEVGNGGIVPSRTSIARFLLAAGERGIVRDKLASVDTAYDAFERFIHTHAGDRVTFNSMLTAAAAEDEEWIAADLQHRRNGFRAMSHAMGIQVKTQVNLFVVNAGDAGGPFDVVGVAGSIGLRVLRAVPSVRVFGLGFGNAAGTDQMQAGPLALSDALGGYLLEAFSSRPLPTLKVSETATDEGKWQHVELMQPDLGNVGTSSLMFGSVYRNVPGDDQPLRFHVTTNKPAEVVFFDVLIKRGLGGPNGPVGKAVLGYNAKYPTDLFPLKGKFDPEYLGHGPAAMTTPEVPSYPDLLQAIADRLGWDLSAFHAWRVRVEFPIYNSTVSVAFVPTAD